MKISDKELMDAYAAALKLALDHEFIQLLEEEIDKRNLRHLVENYFIEQ
ncbi:sporulation histidine kinase inhibitor Sda [Robertmurraya sp. GLU-23]